MNELIEKFKKLDAFILDSPNFKKLSKEEKQEFKELKLFLEKQVIEIEEATK